VVLNVFVGTFIPPMATRPFDPSQAGEEVLYVLSHSLVHSLAPFYPLFNIVALVLLVSLCIWGNRVARVFALYAGLNYVLFALLQGVAITDRGVAIVTGNVIVMLLVAFTRLWEAVVQKGDYYLRGARRTRLWVVPLALLAFWYPLNPRTPMPDFNPLYLVAGSGGWHSA